MNKHRELWLGSIVVAAFCMFVIAGFWFRATTSAYASADDAGTTYNKKCAKCHGKDGRGKTFWGKHTHARDLTESSWQNDVSDERLFNSITNGRGKMPAFKKSLKDSEIDGLVSYVRRLRR